MGQWAECNTHLSLEALLTWGCFLLAITQGQCTEKIFSLFRKRYGSELYKVICIHSHHRIRAVYDSRVDATVLLFFYSRRTVARNLGARWDGTFCLSFAVITDQKLQWPYPYGLHGDTYSFPQTELNQARTNIGLSLSNYGAFNLKISPWLILYFWKNCRQACSQL